MAGLHGCTNHGSVILSRGCLPKVEDPVYSRHQTSTYRRSCFKIVENFLGNHAYLFGLLPEVKENSPSPLLDQ